MSDWRAMIAFRFWYPVEAVERALLIKSKRPFMSLKMYSLFVIPVTYPFFTKP